MKPNEQTPLFKNKLIESQSLYLRQHAHNPVFWYPYGREAIDRARAEDKPILLSVGYSSCHWCHVMEAEVFQNLPIATLMNREFINIKVDREEMPEIDEIYMVARQLMTQQGGWPNTVFLTPQLQPFYAGGTYFANPTAHQPGFAQLLEGLTDAWKNRRSEILASAKRISEAVHYMLQFVGKDQQSLPTNEAALRLYQTLAASYDPQLGGFSRAPKFPMETQLLFLLGYGAGAENKAHEMVQQTLAHMSAGGIQDQVGCGFHRYAVDRHWWVPHFEKMLYNQALLARVYSEGYARYGEIWCGDIAKSILESAIAVFQSPTGAFYAALDAQTDGVEGAFYAWEREEIEAMLTEEERAFFDMFYALAEIPVYPGHAAPKGGVLVRRLPLHQAADEEGMSYLRMAALHGQLMNKLLAVRNLRPSPARDEKILTGWNGLMIAAYAYAGRVLNMPKYLDIAVRAAEDILSSSIDADGFLLHVRYATPQHMPARLEDYSYFIHALLLLQRATNDSRWLMEASTLLAKLDEKLGNADGAGWFANEVDDVTLLQIRNYDDSALPSPNAMMLHNLLDFFEADDNPHFLARAQRLGRAISQQLERALNESATAIHALLRLETITAQQGNIAPENLVECAALVESYDPATKRARIHIVLNVAPGYAIGGQGETWVEFSGQIEAEKTQIKWPQTQQIHGKAGYAGKVELLARVEISGNTPAKVELNIRATPCTASYCAAPITLNRKLEIG